MISPCQEGVKSHTKKLSFLTKLMFLPNKVSLKSSNLSLSFFLKIMVSVLDPEILKPQKVAHPSISCKASCRVLTANCGDEDFCQTSPSSAYCDNPKCLCFLSDHLRN